CFFFQAEDGIRDFHVTGVQTCALPICEPSDIDPHITTGVPENHIQLALFEGLVSKSSATLEIVPGVAESWEVAEDGLSYVFHLRKDARWSNGDSLVADDFVWSWYRALLPS